MKKEKLDQKLEIAKTHAISKGGNCLSTEYINNGSPMSWSCSNPDHKEWNATYKKVVCCGTWCPQCSREVARIKMQSPKLSAEQRLVIAHNHAKEKGGECLSNEYVSARDYLTWKCSNPEHTTWLSWYDTVIRQGHWCPQCANESNISENRVRAIFEVSFGHKFPNSKPEWNINPWTNKPLELDGYCKEFNLAFEYDGEHHFEIDPYNTDRKKNGLIYQQFKDEQKRKNCRKKGITLINIPYIPTHKLNNQQDVLQHVIASCMRFGLSLTFTEKQLQQIKEKF